MTTPNEEANETSSQGALASNAKNDRGADIGGTDAFADESQPKADLGKRTYTGSIARTIAGVVFIAIGVLSIGATLWFAHDGLSSVQFIALKLDIAQFIALLTAHAAVSVATIWFGYQSLRAAERMFVPQHLMDSAANIETIRAIVGIDPPTTAVTKQLEEASKPVMAIAKSIAEIVGKAQNGGTKE